MTPFYETREARYIGDALWHWLLHEQEVPAGVPGTEAPRTAHIRREPGGAAFLRVAAAAAVPPAPCPSYGRCTYPDCGHFLDVTPGVEGRKP